MGIFGIIFVLLGFLSIMEYRKSITVQGKLNFASGIGLIIIGIVVIIFSLVGDV